METRSEKIGKTKSWSYNNKNLSNNNTQNDKDITKYTKQSKAKEGIDIGIQDNSCQYHQSKTSNKRKW